MGRVFTPRFDLDGNVAGLAITGATTGREVDTEGAKRVAELIRRHEPGAAPEPTITAPARKPHFDPGL